METEELDRLEDEDLERLYREVPEPWKGKDWTAEHERAVLLSYGRLTRLGPLATCVERGYLEARQRAGRVAAEQDRGPLLDYDDRPPAGDWSPAGNEAASRAYREATGFEPWPMTDEEWASLAPRAPEGEPMTTTTATRPAPREEPMTTTTATRPGRGAGSPAERAKALGRGLEELVFEANDTGTTPEEVLADWERRLTRTPADYLSDANDAIGLQGDDVLTGFLEEEADDVTYVFVGPKGSGRVTAKQLQEFRYCQSAIMLAIRAPVPWMKQAKWNRQVVGMLMRARTPVDLGDEATPAGRCRSYLQAYLEARPPVEDREEAWTMSHPYTEGGRLYVFGSAFRQWIFTGRSEKLSGPDFGRLMRAGGSEPGRTHVTGDSGRTSVSTWSVPDLG